LRAAYDPRHLLISLEKKPGVPRIAEGDGGGRIGPIWRGLLLKEPGCYLAHRATVFAEQMGMEKDHVFYPVHGTIDRNPYGLALAHPRESASVTAYVERNAVEMWRRPFVIYGLAAVLGLLAAARSGERALLMLALLAGCFAYPALLFIAGPAADARYIFPSNVLCALLIATGAGIVMAERRRA
jgi:hypothetical protein